jgi:ABC-2 type transport system permease protein
MNAPTPATVPGTPPARATGGARRSLPRIYLLEAWYEGLKVIRLPAYLITTILFPVGFYLFFGVAMKGNTGGFDISTYLLATYGAFGAMTASLFNFGVSVAVERAQGWTQFKRATPMPPLAHLVGRLAVSMVVTLVILAILFALGAGLGGVRMPAATWLALAGTLVAGGAVFALFGLALGYWVGPNSAPGVVNLIAMPMALVSGMWIPLVALPAILRQVAHFLPAFHYANLALGIVGHGEGVPAAASVTYLAVFAALSLAAAWLGFRRDEGRTYG